MTQLRYVWVKTERNTIEAVNSEINNIVKWLRMNSLSLTNDFFMTFSDHADTQPNKIYTSYMQKRPCNDDFLNHIKYTKYL